MLTFLFWIFYEYVRSISVWLKSKIAYRFVKLFLSLENESSVSCLNFKCHWWNCSRLIWDFCFPTIYTTYIQFTFRFFTLNLFFYGVLHASWQLFVFGRTKSWFFLHFYISFYLDNCSFYKKWHKHTHNICIVYWSRKDVCKIILLHWTCQ